MGKGFVVVVVVQNRQPDKVQIYETSTGQATIRFSNYKQLEKIEEDESKNRK